MSLILLGILNQQVSGGGLSKYFIGAIQDDTQNLFGRTVTTDPSGNFYVTASEQINSFTYTPTVTKLDFEGAEQWQIRLSGNDGRATNIKTHPSGNLALVPSSGNNRYTNIGFDGTVGTGFIGGSLNSAAGSDVSFDTTNNVIYYWGLNSSTGIRSTLYRFDYSLNFLGQNSVTTDGSNQRNRPRYIATAPGGQSIVTYADDDGNRPKFCSLLNSGGGIVSRLNLPANHQNGGVAIEGGIPYVVSAASDGAYIFKMTSMTNATPTAQRKLGTTSSTAFQSLTSDGNGNLYAQGTEGANIFVVKFDTSLNVIWQRTISGYTSTPAGNLAILPDGDLVVVNSAFISPRTSALFAYLPADGSVTGSVNLSGTTIDLVASNVAVSTPAITSQSANTNNTVMGYTFSSYVPGTTDPNYTLFVQNY